MMTLIVILVLLMPSLVEAVDYYVGQNVTGASDAHGCTNSTSDICLTIARAIAVVGTGQGAAAGKRIIVLPGTYAEILGDGVLPSGSSWSNPFTFLAQGTVILRPNSRITVDVYSNYNSYTIIDGFIFDGEPKPWPASQITIGGSMGEFIIRNNQFINNNNGNAWSSSTNAHHVQWLNNTVHGGNFFASAGGGGDYAYVFYNEGNFMTVDGNTFYDVPSWAIHQNSGNPSNTPGHPTGNIYRNNTIYNFGLVDGRGVGIMLGIGNNNEAYNNVIYNGNVGISTNHGLNLKIYNNTVNGNKQGIQIGQSDVTATITNNIVTNNGTNINHIAGTVTFANNLCTSSGGTTNCAKTGNPLFANAASGDFHLLAGSPAINPSPPLTGCPPTDIDGNNRPPGACDIGAFEYGTAVSIPQELVAAYGFDETSGATVIDSSGKNNNGTFSTGVSRTTDGKYGSALSFNGTGGITIPNSSSLQFNNGFTLQAWVYPTSLASVAAVISKGLSDYYLFASIPYCGTANVIGGFINVGGTLEWLCYTPSLPLNTWTNMATTYSREDGLIKLYIGGSLVTSLATTSLVRITSDPLNIGTSYYNEHFSGKIDSVRLYNYAIPETAGANQCINAPSVMRDMNCPINPTVPPSAVTGFKVGSAGYTIGPGGALTLGQ